MNKPLSKTAKINKLRTKKMELLKNFESKQLNESREIEDIKDGIIDSNTINTFNSKELIEAFKESGINNKDDVFADMERAISNQESIKELVDIKNIKMKTQVTDDQHKTIVILYGAYKTLLSRYNIDFIGLKNILNEFIELATSLEGKRAQQFVDAHGVIAKALADAKLNNNNQIRDNEMKN